MWSAIFSLLAFVLGGFLLLYVLQYNPKSRKGAIIQIISTIAVGLIVVSLITSLEFNDKLQILRDDDASNTSPSIRHRYSADSSITMPNMPSNTSPSIPRRHSADSPITMPSMYDNSPAPSSETISPTKHVLIFNTKPTRATVVLRSTTHPGLTFIKRTPARFEVDPDFYTWEVRKEGFITIYSKNEIYLLTQKRIEIFQDLTTPQNTIDKIIADLKRANIAFNAPETSKVKETWPVILLMSTGLSSNSLESQISSIIPDIKKMGKIYKDSVRVSTRMEAHLSGYGFTVTPVTPIQQLIRDDAETRWEWVITAEKEGMSILYLTLNAFINCNGEQVTQTIQTYRKTIYVYVEPADLILAWFDPTFRRSGLGIFRII